MREDSPCRGCEDRHTACHGSCEKYKAWKDRDLAQKKHLEDNKNRFSVPMTASREKAYAKKPSDHHKYSQGGSYE